MRVYVNHDNCISCGLCVNECPDVFDFDENDKSYIIKQPSSEEEKAVKSCAEVCPASVISVRE